MILMNDVYWIIKGCMVVGNDNVDVVVLII